MGKTLKRQDGEPTECTLNMGPKQRNSASNNINEISVLLLDLTEKIISHQLIFKMAENAYGWVK